MNTVADNDILLDRQPSADVEVEKKAGKKAESVRLPLLAEFTITLSAIIVVIVFLTIVVNSLLRGVTLMDFVIRTSISILVVGGLLTLIARQITSGLLSTGEAPKNQEIPEDLEMQFPPEVN